MGVLKVTSHNMRRILGEYTFYQLNLLIHGGRSRRRLKLQTLAPWNHIIAIRQCQAIANEIEKGAEPTARPLFVACDAYLSSTLPPASSILALISSA